MIGRTILKPCVLFVLIILLFVFLINDVCIKAFVVITHKYTSPWSSELKELYLCQQPNFYVSMASYA